MKILFPCLIMLVCLSALVLPALAEEKATDYAKDAAVSEGMPPVIPHRIADSPGGKDCLACHRTGLNGAPQTPHPERVMCTQCHVRSDLGDPKPSGKSKKGKNAK